MTYCEVTNFNYDDQKHDFLMKRKRQRVETSFLIVFIISKLVRWQKDIDAILKPSQPSFFGLLVAFVDAFEVEQFFCFCLLFNENSSVAL